MAYSNYGYPQYPMQPMYSAPQPQQVSQVQQQVSQPPQMQSGGFISVPSEQIARNYPVAPGNVMTFKIENQPYVCEKAQGFSQLEGPIFNKYRLVKEEVPETPQQPEAIVDTSTLQAEVDHLKEELKELREMVCSKNKPIAKKSADRGGHEDE